MRGLPEKIAIVLAAGLAAVASAAHAEQEAADAGVAGDATTLNLPLAIADPGGARRALSNAGIQISAYHTGDVLGNVSGGLTQSTHFASMLELYADIDAEKLLGWRGLTLHASGSRSQGTSISAENLGSLAAASNIEAFPSTRLVELWIEQQLVSDTLSIRIGQLAPDLEFLMSESGSHFMNSTFVWPSIGWDNIPVPFASPGFRLSYKPSGDLSIVAGLMNGDPVGPCPEEFDPAQCNRHGLDFRLGDPPLLYGETALSHRYIGRDLPGKIKIGGWRHFGEFEDQRRDDGGGRLGSSMGNPLLHEGNHGFFLVMDQKVYRRPGSDELAGLSVFARLAGSPSEFNQVDFYVDAGFVFTGLHPARPRDNFAVALAYSRISQDASGFDKDLKIPVVRDHECVLEVNYTAEILPGWKLQPDVQYFWHPGGRAPDETGTRAVADAAIFGMRSSVEY